ncbi:MAG: sulfur carrier protein ThiS [Bacteroidia bacterium]|nr:sulfur carrier protein ThiS [Bacteroidia bacterium]
MDLIVNGKPQNIDDQIKHISELLDYLGILNESGGIAVAINQSVISKTDWESITLKAGDSVDIITARQGG